MYTKGEKQYNAEQLKEEADVSCGEGTVRVPQGYWIVKDESGIIIECPSDEAFNNNYSTSAPKATTPSLFSPRRRTSSFRRTRAYLTSPAMTRCSTSAGIIRSTTISTRSPATHRNGTSRHGRVAEARRNPIVTTA